MGEKGRAIGIDHIQSLVDKSIVNVRKNHPELLESQRVKLVVGDGRLGFAEEGDFLPKLHNLFNLYLLISF